jgi:serine/threonine protein kinase
MTASDAGAAAGALLTRTGIGLSVASRLASEIKVRWQISGQPDVASVLAAHPELNRYRSIVLDLACHEYRWRVARGESLDAEVYSRRFPSLQKSLYMLIEVQRLLDQDAGFRLLERDLLWPEPGQCFLGFSLLAELGRGTFGRVFLATEPALGNRLVAIKIAPQGGEEAEMLGRLQHPNIMPVYSVQEDPETGLTAVCMPYLGRATLCDILDYAFVDSVPPAFSQAILDAIRADSDEASPRTPIAQDRLLRKGSYVEGVVHLGQQLAEALAYTHSRGIVHRDLKPSNVLVPLDGRPLLMDFNLSIDRQLSVGKIGGTLPYMAPEQLRAVVFGDLDGLGHTDPRSDLFSLGVILYELLGGVLPFGVVSWERSVDEVAEGLLEAQRRGPRPLQERNRQVDRSLARLIQSCLEFDSDNRPASAASLAAAFQRELRATRRGMRWIRNHRRRASLAGAFASILVGVTVGLLALRDPYCVRQFRQGIEYYRQGQYQLAVASLDESIRANPGDPDAVFARGRAYQKLGNYRQAFEDYHAIGQESATPQSIACKGYCLGKMRYHRDAIDCCQQALDMGYRSPSVLNNIAYSLIQLRKLDDAERYLEQALDADEGIQAAHTNLISVLLNRALSGQPVNKTTLARLERALEACASSADLYLCAAELYALAAEQEKGLRAPALEYLQKAIAHGSDPKSWASNRAFFSLRGEEGFRELLEESPGAGPSAKAEGLVDPV